MNSALDIVLVILLAVCIFAGYKRGFVKSLTDLVSNIVAFIGAKIISVSLAPVIYENYYESALRDKIEMKFAQSGSDAAEKISKAIEEIPNISNILSMLGVDKEQAVGSVTSQVQGSGTDMAQALMTNIVTPVATFILRIIIFIIAFVICIFLMKLIARALDKASKLPVLKQANKAFGLLFGAIKGVIVIVLVCAVIELIVGITGSEELSTIVGDSYIVSAFNTVLGGVNI